MLKVGITGGIGSGKSIVCRAFETLGIPVFSADDAARYLIENDAALIASIKTLFGPQVYKNGRFDRGYVSSVVFSDPTKLNELNNLVHPATIRYGKQWLDSQTTPYAIKEAAIFFETGSNKDMDVMIGVYAPKELRRARAMQRLKLTVEQVDARIAQQMDEEKKMSLCDYVITNDEATALIPQVLSLHQTLSDRAAGR